MSLAEVAGDGSAEGKVLAGADLIFFNVFAETLTHCRDIQGIHLIQKLRFAPATTPSPSYDPPLATSARNICDCDSALVVHAACEKVVYKKVRDELVWQDCLFLVCLTNYQAFVLFTKTKRPVTISILKFTPCHLRKCAGQITKKNEKFSDFY